MGSSMRKSAIATESKDKMDQANQRLKDEDE